MITMNAKHSSCHNRKVRSLEMAVILSALFGRGKSTLAAKMCFTGHIGDQVIACGIAGGYTPTMTEGDGCANYVPDLCDKLVHEYASHALDPLDNSGVAIREILEGDFFKFVNGVYMPSSFAPLCLHREHNVGDLVMFCFDGGGFFCNYPESLFVVLYNRISREGDVLCRSELVFDRVIPSFVGLPYLKVGESAVAAPTEWAHPVSRVFNTHDVSLRIQNELIGQLLQEESVMAQLAANDALEDFARTQGTTFSSNPVISAFIYGMDDSILSQRARALKALYLKALNVELKAHVSSVQKEKAEFRTHNSHVILNSKGRPFMDNFPATELLLGLNRCVCDSITGLVMGATGNALSGGLPAGFVQALASTNHSDCIVVYTPLSTDEKGDPFYKKQMGGYVDGHVYSDVGTVNNLFEGNFYVSTRAAAVNRQQKFPIFVNGVSFGNSVYRVPRGDGKFDIIKYGVDDKAYTDKYDPKLEAGVLQPNVYTWNVISTLEYSSLPGEAPANLNGSTGAFVPAEDIINKALYGRRSR